MILPAAVVDGWVMTVGGLLIPVAGAMRIERKRQTNPIFSRRGASG